ncbi:MAG: hypothetical protein JO060_01620 [Candidatus Eremiobacteraeota bacterium]|nr:hypothetical protein [Candidatus Eremiobacteraeota bacterium]
MTLAVEISLIIPDNEARTAQATLQRLGIDVGELQRMSLWRLEIDAGERDALLEVLKSTETIYNPNKNRLRVRDVASPERAEVWVDEPDSPAAHTGPPYIFAGRALPGVTRLERFVAWRLMDRGGKPAPDHVVEGAVETLLCNTAFQRAIR